MKKIKLIYQSILFYFRVKLSRVQFLMIVATFVGLFSGLAAVLFKLLVQQMQRLIEINSGSFFWMFPIVGLLLTSLIIHFFFKTKFEKGIALVLRAIARKSSIIPLKDTYFHIITSTFTVGFGGSAGLEAPIVATGSAIGSNIARVSDLNYQERTLLIACGAAAGIGAVFNAPIAGVIFAIEVLLAEAVISYFIPIIISSVIGVLCSKIILQENLLFSFVLKQTFNYKNVPYYILLGILCSFISLYYARAFKFTEHKMQVFKINFLVKACFGGLLLMFLFFVMPPLFGEGYHSIKQVALGNINFSNYNSGINSFLQTNWGIVLFSGIIILFKPIATGITLGSGGNGGNFAPSLFTGAFLGFFFSRILNIAKLNIPVGNFSLVGMAGVLAGVMYCPLTATFLIAEITNGYELFIPLMIVSAISFFIVKTYQPHSMETKKLASDGEIFTQSKEKNILTTISLHSILEDNYQIIEVEKKLIDLVEVIKHSEKNIFPVKDKAGKFIGIIELNDIKQKIFQKDQLQINIRSIVKKPKAILDINENMHSVMNKFDMTQSWYLPVLNEQNIFVGFISKSKLFDKYREILAMQGDIYENK